MKKLIPLLLISFVLAGAGCVGAPEPVEESDLDAMIDELEGLMDDDVEDDDLDGEVEDDGEEDEVTCERDGVEYQPGDAVPSLDGCNECSCDSDGSISCTEEFCEPAEDDADTSSDDATDDAPVAASFSMDSGNFFFSPSSLSVEAGQEVSITFASNSGTHTFVIDEIGLNESVAAGKTITFTAPSQPGTYEYYCDVGSHQQLGMEGTLTVQ